ncbi:hypothetical protein Q7C36_014778 [Tachysurus vachellii]|uniref:Immunoglobulin domain-containing protein n=1 Tax=Tachysurus vachellii TaxID=175792 RepID=A0AA88MA92_TACVA|nr:hypothetical protein Q7C36_014778 [Tachysurus vachellii]
MFSGGCVLDMAEFLSGFNLLLLIGVISLSLLQNISAVDPGENVTLFCNSTNYSEISWYHMNSAGKRQIINADRFQQQQRKVDKHFYTDYNEDKSHFTISESSSSVSLVIIGVRDTDLGFYYCGGRNKEHIQFGKVISLNFTGGSRNETRSSSEDSDSHQTGGTENIWIIHMIIIHDTSSTEQDENLHYASVQYKRRTRKSSMNNTTSDLDSVTYAIVTSQPQRH